MAGGRGGQGRCRWVGMAEREEQVRKILLARVRRAVRGGEPARAGKSFEERSDVVAKFSIGDLGSSQDVLGEDVEIKRGGDGELPALRQNRLDQPGLIEDCVARFLIRQEVDERDGFVRRARQRAHDKVKICRREARPTNRLDHREAIMSHTGPNGQA